MPARWCQCSGCAACGVTSGRHGVLYDRESAPGYRCPPCQQAHGQQTERQRAQQRGGTARRGYGGAHRKTRERLLAQWQPGQPCAHCGKPMWDKTGLDLAHTADRSGYRGLAHAECNRGNR